MTTATEERYEAVLHKRHGWIVAPTDYWIRESVSGKSYELCCSNEQYERDSCTAEHGRRYFPFGTRWNTTSVLALSGFDS